MVLLKAHALQVYISVNPMENVLNVLLIQTVLGLAINVQTELVSAEVYLARVTQQEVIFVTPMANVCVGKTPSAIQLFRP